LAFSGDYYRSLITGQARGLWPTFQRSGLRLASVPYGWAVGLRNQLYERGWRRSHRAAVPVVSVGNLTLGGTGKTPCVEYVARLYRQQDLRVAILSRGYGSSAGRNDEALVLEENLPDVPHLQDVDRVGLAHRVRFDVPERYTPRSRIVPTAAEVRPKIETIIRLWEDPASSE